MIGPQDRAGQAYEPRGGPFGAPLGSFAPPAANMPFPHASPYPNGRTISPVTRKLRLAAVAAAVVAIAYVGYRVGLQEQTSDVPSSGTTAASPLTGANPAPSLAPSSNPQAAAPAPTRPAPSSQPPRYASRGMAIGSRCPLEATFSGATMTLVHQFSTERFEMLLCETSPGSVYLYAENHDPGNVPHSYIAQAHAISTGYSATQPNGYVTFVDGSTLRASAPDGTIVNEEKVLEAH